MKNDIKSGQIKKMEKINIGEEVEKLRNFI